MSEKNKWIASAVKKTSILYRALHSKEDVEIVKKKLKDSLQQSSFSKGFNKK